MDVVLDLADTCLLDRVWAFTFPSPTPCIYPSSSPSNASCSASLFPRDSLLRQSVSLYLMTLFGVLLLYFTLATASYYYIFDHRMMKHPRFIPHQVRLEIECSLRAFPMAVLLTLPWFIGEVRGHSQLYDNVGDVKGLSLRPIVKALRWLGVGAGSLPSEDVKVGGGWTYMVLSAAFFLWFTDLAIYFVHRYEHHPLIYKHIHKPHHKWIIPTPFASHAFHPLDGYAQSLPYHVFVFLFPLHKYLYLGLFVFVNLWSILIHDSEMIVDHPLENVVNGPSHHTLHHIYFNCNYGQYFTWADRVGGSYRHPVKGEDPLIAVLAAQEKKAFPAVTGPSDSSASRLSSHSTNASRSPSPIPSSSLPTSDESDSDSEGGGRLLSVVGLRSQGTKRRSRSSSSSAGTSVDGGEDEK